ncbi:MAG TPA: NAD(P)-dependent alcohol dehydrogenase [bacterium]|nr:NAD(P)-dependent alcohol dehydrogenase [bacterium]
MQAWSYSRFGKPEVLRLGTAPDPRPGPNEYLIRVHTAALNPKDGLIRRGSFRLLSGSRFPKFIGLDYSGTVVERGAGATGFRVGDQVYGHLDEWKGRQGTLSEYVRATADQCALMPAGLSFEEAAGLSLVSQTALQALRDIASIRSGDRVLINGGGGGVGAAAIQIARIFEARVVAVCGPNNLEFCRGLGAEEVLDYTREDPLAGSTAFRIVFDTYGNLPFSRARRALTRDGVYVGTVFSRDLFFGMIRSLWSRPRAGLVRVKSRRQDLERVTRWVESGRLRPVIERSFDFDQVVAAYRHLEKTHSRGKVVVRIS